MPKVYNKHHGDAPEGAVYVGRGTVWGNPHKITDTCDRKTALALYKAWLKRSPFLLELISKELRGKDLVCYCAPKPCHADILLEIANYPMPSKLKDGNEQKTQRTRTASSN